MKFKVDENLPAEIADVCRREGRILVSLDLCSSDIRACPPGDWPGFMVLRLWRRNKPRVLGAFRKALALSVGYPF